MDFAARTLAGINFVALLVAGIVRAWIVLLLAGIVTVLWKNPYT